MGRIVLPSRFVHNEMFPQIVLIGATVIHVEKRQVEGCNNFCIIIFLVSVSRYASYVDDKDSCTSGGIQVMLHS